MALPATASLPQSGSIISRWKLDEASGTRADNVGTNTLADNNTVLSSTGPFGDTCADFEAGSSEYLSIADASQTGLDLSSNFTFAAWINVESDPGTYTIMGKADAGGDAYRLFYRDDGTKRFNGDIWTAGAAESDFSASQSLTTGTWYHIAMVWTIGTPVAQMYVNGNSITTSMTATSATTIVNNSAPFTLGAIGNPALFFDGKMQDAIIWNVALSGANVTSLYNAYTAPAVNYSKFLLLGIS